jgi:hypothetical protein
MHLEIFFYTPNEYLWCSDLEFFWSLTILPTLSSKKKKCRDDLNLRKKASGLDIVFMIKTSKLFIQIRQIPRINNQIL